MFLLLLGTFAAGKENSFFKAVGIVSLLAGGFLLASSVLLLTGWWPLH
jgi:CHASE2 domain-containing sensor protein